MAKRKECRSCRASHSVMEAVRQARLTARERDRLARYYEQERCTNVRILKSVPERIERIPSCAAMHFILPLPGIMQKALARVLDGRKSKKK